MTTEVCKPIKTRRTRYHRLSQAYQLAVANASDCLAVGGNCRVRIETYATADIRRIVEDVWQWTATLAAIDDRNDRARVRKIMALIPTDGAWPYVSYWAGDMEELMETTQEDGYLSVPNHGDGWHRIIACIELGLPTIDVLFLEGEHDKRQDPYR